jgi:hypothetical protein
MTIPPSRRTAVAWAAVGLLLLVQWALFRQYALREVVWGYPENNDQVAYLRLAYMTYERVLEQGLARGLAWGFMARQPNGAMLHVQAPLLFLVTGPSRLSALSLNLVYFVLLELTLVWTVVRLTRRWSLALLGLGLLLAAATPFYMAGGFMDFRIDFIAWCLYAIFISLVVLSGLFLSRRFSIAAGAAAGLLVLFRVITVVYLGGIFLAVAVYLAWRWRRSRRALEPGPPVATQLWNFAYTAGITAACAVGVIASRFSLLRSYYVAGHLTSSEKHIRAAEQGLSSVTDHLLFYPTSFLRDHAGPVFLTVAGVTLVVALALAWMAGTRHDPAQRRVPDVPGMYVFLGACIVVPLVVLTADTAKSAVVADILVGPVVWIVLWTLIVAARADRAVEAAPSVRRTLQVLGCSALAAGAYSHVSHLSSHGTLYEHKADVGQVVALYDAIGEYSRMVGSTSPRISVDRVDDFLFAPLLDPLMYERKGVLMTAGFGLGASIFPVTESDAFDLVRNSDFLVLSEGNPYQNPARPFNRAMEAIRPRLRQFADSDLLLLGRFPMFGFDRLLYVRPVARLSGDSGGWITSSGFTLTAPGAVFRRWPRIELRGDSPFAWLPRTPVIEARMSSGRRLRPVAATLSRSANAYCILLDIDPNLVDPAGLTTLRIAFDVHFVAKGDPRELVIRTPTSQSLRRSDEDGEACRLPGPS